MTTTQQSDTERIMLSPQGDKSYSLTRRRRRRLRTAHQPAWQRAGRRAVALDDGAADDRRRIAVGALHEAPSAARRIMRDLVSSDESSEPYS